MHLIIGAGPAGLTAAWELARRGEGVIVLESDPEYVGGIAKTVRHHGNRFDLGGHRFYTKHPEIETLWREMLPDDFVTVPRLSRIYYESKFYKYPIEIGDALTRLGFRRAIRILASYARAKVKPRHPEVSFEDWVVNRFGWQLYVTFFRSYTEKVWGMPCDELSKDFAAQRIRGLSLGEVLRNALRGGDSNAKSLITEFKYPRLGPGQLWEAVCDDVISHGGSVEMNCEVDRVRHRDGRVECIVTTDGTTRVADHFYSTMPLSKLIRALDPPPPRDVIAAADRLIFRDFLTVGVVVARSGLFADNWIYVHSPDVSVGRIQNYGNWSASMVAEPATSSLGMEYFCQKGDALWEMSDEDLQHLAAKELETIGLACADECIDSVVVRVKDAYPVYDASYQGARETIKEYLNSNFDNLHPAGRGGLHNYNSQDHSMMAGMAQVRRVLDERSEDVWLINAEQEYAETTGAKG